MESEILGDVSHLRIQEREEGRGHLFPAETEICDCKYDLIKANFLTFILLLLNVPSVVVFWMSCN